MAVDLTGTFNVTRLAIPQLKKSAAGKYYEFCGDRPRPQARQRAAQIERMATCSPLEPTTQQAVKD
jgi:NAD(P)-dependent dehydrogenase (short-subunit alcohol dehydrogenase family)